MDKIADFYVCKSKDHYFGIVVMQSGRVYLDKITPEQLENSTAKVDVMANGHELTSSGILDSVIKTLLKNTPVPSSPCEKKEKAEVVPA